MRTWIRNAYGLPARGSTGRDARLTWSVSRAGEGG